MEKKEKLLKLVLGKNLSEEKLDEVILLLSGKVPLVVPVNKSGGVGFISETQAREYLGGISRSTLWIWRKDGLKSYMHRGRRLFKPADLDDFILNSTVKQ